LVDIPLLASLFHRYRCLISVIVALVSLFFCHCFSRLSAGFRDCSRRPAIPAAAGVTAIASPRSDVAALQDKVDIALSLARFDAVSRNDLLHQIVPVLESGQILLGELVPLGSDFAADRSVGLGGAAGTRDVAIGKSHGGRLGGGFLQIYTKHELNDYSGSQIPNLSINSEKNSPSTKDIWAKPEPLLWPDRGFSVLQVASQRP
jgi:hypothetical protein